MELAILDGAGIVSTTAIPFVPRRSVRIVTGLLAELERAPCSEDFVMGVLTDETPPIDPMKRLRVAFPNACQLAYAKEVKKQTETMAVATTLPTSPVDVIESFMIQVRGEGLRDGERLLVDETLAALQEAGETE